MSGAWTWTRHWLLQPVRRCDAGTLARDGGGIMAKLHGAELPSNQMRYEHYDPR